MGCPIRKGGVGSPLQVRYTKSGGGGGGNSLQVHYEKWGGGGQFASGPLRKVGGGAICFRSITKSGGGGGGGQFTLGPLRKVGGGGGGGNSLQVHYEKWGGGGGHFASGPLQNVGGAGGDVSSPIGVWVEAPEASQAETRTT